MRTSNLAALVAPFVLLLALLGSLVYTAYAQQAPASVATMASVQDVTPLPAVVVTATIPAHSGASAHGNTLASMVGVAKPLDCGWYNANLRMPYFSFARINRALTEY